jgi:hypothetical protein
MKYPYSAILFVIFSSAISLSQANESTLLPIEINKEASYLLDEQSILHDGYRTNATLIIKPSEKQIIKDLSFGSASYIIQAQCINKVVTPQNGILHEDANAQGNAIEQEAISSYHKIVPISVDQKVIAHLCLN